MELSASSHLKWELQCLCNSNRKSSEQSLIKLVCARGLHQKLSGKVNLHLNWSAITSTLCNTQIELCISVLSCKKTGT